MKNTSKQVLALLLVVSLTMSSCKIFKRDKCGDCPTFSEYEQVDECLDSEA